MNKKGNVSVAVLLISVTTFFAGLCSAAQSPAERMQKIVQSYADAGVFMGNVLVAKNGKVIFSKSYGWQIWSGAYRIRPRPDSTSPR
jgi:hypothetical protein